MDGIQSFIKINLKNCDILIGKKDLLFLERRNNLAGKNSHSSTPVNISTLAQRTQFNRNMQFKRRFYFQSLPKILNEKSWKLIA